MINEQDKQKIFNGAFAVSRDGRKCKFIGKTAHSGLDDVSLNIFIYFNSNELVTGIHHLTDDLIFSITYESDNDVVGLWENKPEPFDLERALNGEAVMLRGNKKAYVKYLMPDEYTGPHCVIGYVIDASNVGVFTYGWCLDGRAVKENYDHHLDIIGMWREPEPISNTVTLTLPCPLKEPQAKMWILAPDGYTQSSYDENIPLAFFNSRIYFGSEEDAKEWYFAMKDNRK